MTDSADKGQGFAATIANAVNSKAAEKLADAVKGIVDLGHNALDYAVGPKRIQNIGKARADVLALTANTEMEISDRRRQAAERLFDKECRNQENIQAITEAALKALPKNDADVSQEPVSEDFIYRFFDECQGIGNEQMQQIWGKLLAGEVSRPGSFHPKTLGIVRDMQMKDAEMFSALCRFTIHGIGSVILNLNDDVYGLSDVSFRSITQLETLGLVRYMPIGSYTWTPVNQNIYQISYGDKRAIVDPTKGAKVLNVGGVMLTAAGKELSTLCSVEAVPYFFDYVVKKWHADGVHITVV